MPRLQRFFLLLVVLLNAEGLATAETLQITIGAGAVDHHNAPVCVPLELPNELADSTLATLVDPAGNQLTGQLTQPGLLDQREMASEGHVLRELHFILPKLPAGQSVRYAVTPSELATDVSFSWHDTPGEQTELRDGKRTILQYMYRPLDESSPAAREQTYKVFHHLFNPAGTRRVTKGPGGLYTITVGCSTASIE